MSKTVDLTTKYLPYVDELFTKESKTDLVTNKDLDWTGAHSVKVYSITTAKMNDYNRNGGGLNRYGTPEDLNATTNEYMVEKDRSFTFVIDRMDEEETLDQLSAASALARQIREVVIPEVDTYVYSQMTLGAGTKPEALVLTNENIYDEIIKASLALDNAEVPESNRVLIVTPAIYQIMKKCKDIVMETNVGQDMRLKGVIANLDGMTIIKIPANRLPANFGFMVCHPCATVAPKKLESWKIHDNPPGINGYLVEGRIVYDGFILLNKAEAVYYQATKAE